MFHISYYRCNIPIGIVMNGNIILLYQNIGGRANEHASKVLTVGWRKCFITASNRISKYSHEASSNK